MKTYARIYDGIVVELLETAGDIALMFHPDMVWVEADASVNAGDLYQDGVFTRPSPPEPEPAPERTYSPLEFLDLFTEDEQLAATVQKQTNPHISLWFDRLIAAGFVRKSDPRVPAGLDAMVTVEVITPQRKEEIFNAM